MTEIYIWKVECYPFNKNHIRSMILYIEAANRKEAELIVLNQAHKFFDQDMSYVWSNPIESYRND